MKKPAQEKQDKTDRLTIGGIVFYPKVARKLKVEEFVKLHIGLEAFKPKMKKGEKKPSAAAVEAAEKRLKEIHKNF